MLQLTSPRLPGVPILQVSATGPEYSRWRRSVKYASKTKDTWKYCNGKCTMPMPKAGPNSKSSKTSSANAQPSLLDERRAWARQDREVKLDIFLSLAEEVMQDVFEVGPPLPPSNLNAHKMLEALDERFLVFKFESYHHTFCHFLNLHIDQYTTIEEFNKEFSATLEDLLDHGQPLSNTQACSAYFSKLRCTQNPWVAKQLEEWDGRTSEPELIQLMKESPPWSCIRPLVTKPSQTFHVQAIPEEHLEDSSVHSDSDTATEPSNASTVSSVTTHSRHVSNATAHSQEITIHASSEDIAEIDPRAFQIESEYLHSTSTSERPCSEDRAVNLQASKDTSQAHSPVPDWLSTKKSIARMPLPAPIDRPLPPLPPQALQSSENETRARSASPRGFSNMPKNSSQTSLTVPTNSTSSPPTSTPASHLHLETIHPTLRPRTPTTPPSLTDHPAFRSNASRSTEQLTPDVHRALRPTTPTPRPATATQLKLPAFITSSPNLAIPWPCTPDDVPRHPHSLRAALPLPQALPQPAISLDREPIHPLYLKRIDSTNSSIISLPLQGARDSAWDYLSDATHPLSHPSRSPSVSPINSFPTSPSLGQDFTALPQLKGTMSRAPTFDDFIIPSSPPPPVVSPPLPLGNKSTRATPSHSKSSSVGSVTGGGEDVEFVVVSEKERMRRGQGRKKKGWSVGVNLARFSASKGVREII